MKSLLNVFTGHAAPKRSRRNRRFRPCAQALESRLLLAGADCGPEVQGQERVDGEQVVVAPIQDSSQTRATDDSSRIQNQPKELIDLVLTNEDSTDSEVNRDPESTTSLDESLSLVVAQPQQVHEEIADLLGQLRRLQDLQITIEVRFITLQDNFFQQIGVDFDFEVDDTAPEAQNALSGVDVGPTVGDEVDSSGDPTPGLGSGQVELGSEVPEFGGFEPSDSGFGFAILSDIEAFFLTQAAQADARANVQQAPTVTMFNGQSAQINDMTSRPFVTSLVPVVG